MAKHYIQAINRGAVITRDVTISTTKALIKKNQNLISNVDVSSSYWANSLLRRIGTL